MSVRIIYSDSIDSGVNHGHVAIDVNGTVYSYGRYGDGWDGVLRIYNHDDYYIDQLKIQGHDPQTYSLDITHDEE